MIHGDGSRNGEENEKGSINDTEYAELNQRESDTYKKQNMFHESNDGEEKQKNFTSRKSHNPRDYSLSHPNAYSNYAQVNHHSMQRSFGEYRPEVNNPYAQKAETDPMSTFQYHREQDPHRNFPNHGVNPNGHDQHYSSNYQASSSAIAKRPEVPQATHYPPNTYRFQDGISPNDGAMTPSGHAYEPNFHHAPNTGYTTDPMTPAWHHYNGMMTAHPTPSHNQYYNYNHFTPTASDVQQYPQGSHIPVHSGYHSNHPGNNDHYQMTHISHTQVPHPYHVNNDNYSREQHHSHQGGNTFTPNSMNASHTFLLATEEDEKWLSEFLCFVRWHCIEAFCASQHDVFSRSGSKKVKLGQVGFRCRFCANSPEKQRSRRSSTFPSSLSRVYQSLTMMLRDHFPNCSYMPPKEKQEYTTLRSNSSQGVVGSKDYWVTSAKSLGLIDTTDGIFLNDGRHAANSKKKEHTSRTYSDC
mmetsp:Transcript_36103/g.55038  ORF Transcript_36103/g.55038 Transcript_36103/m.55038 type:complete len:469 (+) Transcript_36103:352-1758(+)